MAMALSCTESKQESNRVSDRAAAAVPRPLFSRTAVSREGSDRAETIAVCLDQAEWLVEVAGRHCPPNTPEVQWHALRRLIDFCNREPPKAKKHIFMTVRCRRCLQHTRGGDKREYVMQLPTIHWQWLESVQQRCQHPTVGKTIRIMIDFYKPLCEGDSDFERAIFQAMQNTNSEDAHR